ncbi:MAG: hypothetical protein WCJ03_01825 [Bacteroidales bacterium]
MRKRISFILIVALTYTLVSAQTYKEWLDRSYLAADGKDWVSAVDCLRNALRAEPANPQNAWLLSNMGTMQRNMDNKDAARQSYTNGLLFAPNSVTLLLNRAALLLEMDSLTAALSDYNSVILLEEKNVEALVSRGEICLALNDTVAARRDFETVIKLDSHNLRALSGSALQKKIVGQYVESEKIYNLLISQLPDNQSLLFNRAELYYLNQKFPKALTDVNKVIKLSDQDPLNYFLRGKIHFSLYEQKLAYQDFLKSKELGYRSEELAYWLKKSR